jgi:hypothetical protein
MKQILKAVFLLIRAFAYHFNFTKLYYWAELRVFRLRSVKVIPESWYCWMYRISMALARKKRCLKFADWMIHRIPYNVRCDLS